MNGQGDKIGQGRKMMKVISALVVSGLIGVVGAEEERRREVPGAEERVGPDARLVKALGKLEEKLGIRFTIPFPKNYDPDAYKKQPLAVLEVDGDKVCITRPVVNPYDEPRTVEWMIGPEDPEMLSKADVDCWVSFDERGEFSRVILIADWADDGTGNHQIERANDESGRDFFERARLTLRDRAGKAEDAAMARVYVEAFEKVARAVQGSMREVGG